MASNKMRHGPSHLEWFVDCEVCGSEQRMTIVHGLTRKDKRAMCLGCHSYLPPNAKTYKKL